MPRHPAQNRIKTALDEIELIDPHSHINPHAPASETLADLLGYHYYTELAHSAGMPKSEIEEPGISSEELVERLVSSLSPLENTAQYRWLIELCRKFFDFEDDRLTPENWRSLFDSSKEKMVSANWADYVLESSNVKSVFLTNDFDDPLERFDADTYIPCLRTDDLVFHLHDPAVRERLAGCTDIAFDGSLQTLRTQLENRFQHFVGRGARACAISLPPDFNPSPISDARATVALDAILRLDSSADLSDRSALSRRVFWTLAELCDQYGLPFDLMIGVNRKVYADGVFQGQDLYDSRVSLLQYRKLFNAFSDVRFPVSVLASVTNQELVSHAWIFPNVYTNGHWWYSNTPSFIARDAMARLEAIPSTKQVGYYSDAYKLEFIWPKFDMYRNVLAGLLCHHFIDGCGWSEERAIELGTRVLRGNVDELFPKVDLPEEPDTTPRDETSSLSAAAATLDDTNLDQLDEAEEVIVVEAAKIPDINQVDLDSLDLDPSPGVDDLGDLEDTGSSKLSDLSEMPSPESIAAEIIDEEPLDVGILLDEEDGSSTFDPEPPNLPEGVKPLTGSSSFIPDGSQMKLVPDPVTGELTMPPIDQDSSSEEPEIDFDIVDEDDGKKA
ncbi:MAG: glucuronate isomerase [Planctomycetota bacterium]